MIPSPLKVIKIVRHGPTIQQASVEGKLEQSECTPFSSAKNKHMLILRYADTYPLYPFSLYSSIEHTLLLASVSYWFYFQPSILGCKVICYIGEIECGFLHYA